MGQSLPNADQKASEKPQEIRSASVEVRHGVRLDHRKALVGPEAGWLAIADLHYGFESHRRKQGALIRSWGRETARETLSQLLEEHRPQRLILLGDLVEGAGATEEAIELLQEMESRVDQLVCVLGNHDRGRIRKAFPFLPIHSEGRFLFHHGHQPKQVAEWVAGHPAPAERWIHVCGHAHPAACLRDGAGLRLRFPALVRERLEGRGDPLTQSRSEERWTLPAFSPWSAGSELRSPHRTLGTWACLPDGVLPLKPERGPVRAP